MRPSSYSEIIKYAFQKNYKSGMTIVPFNRDDLIETQQVTPKNLGDIVYSFRYRKPLPIEISSIAPDGHEWIIEPAGNGRYQFRIVTLNRIIPNESLKTIVIPDNTPELVKRHRRQDEQAILGIIHTNNLLGLFTGCRLDRMQSHLRTNIPNIGQIEIDDVYIGIGGHGAKFITPVQAKGGKDQISVVQTLQDIRACNHIWPDLACRPISVHCDENTGRMAFIELEEKDGIISVANESHYVLGS